MSAPLTIENCWLAVSVDEEGDEGVCAALIGHAWMPLMAADRARLPFVLDAAQKIADETGQTIKIIRLTERSEIKTITRRKS